MLEVRLYILPQGYNTDTYHSAKSNKPVTTNSKLANTNQTKPLNCIDKPFDSVPDKNITGASLLGLSSSLGDRHPLYA